MVFPSLEEEQGLTTVMGFTLSAKVVKQGLIIRS